MITFKRPASSGRMSFALKQLISDVNEKIQDLPVKERAKYSIEVTSEKQLQEMFRELSGEPPLESKQEAKTPASEEPVREPEQKLENQKNMEEEFSPITEAPVKERTYNAQGTVVENQPDIPEPTFGAAPPPPPSNSQEPQFASAPQPQGSPQPQNQAWQTEPSTDYEPLNPAMTEMDDKSKKLDAGHLVDTVLDAYKMAHTFGANYAKMDTMDIMKKVQSGELDPSLQIPVDEQTIVTPMEFFESQNEQIDEAISYDEEFGKKVRPVMIRVFEKKGWGLSDEQYLMVAFGKDIAMKAALLIGMKKSQKAMMDQFIMMSQMNHRAAEAPVTSVQPDNIIHPDKTEPIHQEEQPMQSAEDVEAQFTEDAKHEEVN